LLGTIASFGQSEFSSPKPAVSVLRVDAPALQKGKSVPVTLTFHVSPGFHINSNHPNSEMLIATELHLDPPTDLSVGNVQFPAGEQLAFQFAPDEKLSVYAGDFNVTATARTVGPIRPGSYRVHGDLRYQACDDHACYPPKSVPVAFDVHVTLPPKAPRHNPAQSPDVHQ
jgi:hypothetical protein